MIPQDTIDQVREATDIAQIIGLYVRLKKRGHNFKGICPFHGEKTPSFNVNIDRQIYHCFGCGKGGNVFTFLMEHEHMSFIEAVKFLAARANIPIRESGSDFKRDLLERLNYAHQVAVEYYHRTLFEARYKTVLDTYLTAKRHITKESIDLFQLGLAGEEWDGLLKFAAKKDLSPEELVRAGLASKSEKGGQYYDRFRQRLMIPIFNLSNKPIAFGGRALKKGEPAKYINSPETPLYSKSNVLYGLNFAKEHIRETNAVYVVEGYFDFISLFQAGIKNVVASSGTAFTEQQARLLARFAEDALLFFDADSAGQKAALRSVDSLYDAGLEVKVIVAPDGEDPDSLARKFGAERIEQLRSAALGFIPFRIRTVDIEETGIIAREKLVKELSTLSSKINDPTRRALFIQEAAGHLAVDPELFKSASAGKPRAEAPRAGTGALAGKVERDFLSLLLCNPGSIDEAFEAVSPDDLDSKQLSRLYAAMIQQYKIEGELDAGRLIEHFQDEDAISLLSEIATVEWDLETIESETKARIREFQTRKQKRIRARLQQELRVAEDTGDNLRAEEIMKELRQHGL
jgi:DNA primase